MNKKKSRKHHTVPQMLLKHFTGNDPQGKVWVYDNNIRVYPSLPKEIASQKNYYSFSNDEKNRNDEFEDMFSYAESKAAPIYEKLLTGHIPQGEEREHFADFLACMCLRTTSVRKAAANYLGYYLHEEAQKADDERNAVNSNKIEEIIINGKPDLIIFKKLGKISEIFCKMNWNILGSEVPIFITTDNPLIIRLKDINRGPFDLKVLTDKNVIITFPLSPVRCMLLHCSIEEKGDHITYLTSSASKYLNKIRVESFDRYVISHCDSEGIKKLIRKINELIENSSSIKTKTPKITICRN